MPEMHTRFATKHHAMQRAAQFVMSGVGSFVRHRGGGYYPFAKVGGKVICGIPTPSGQLSVPRHFFGGKKRAGANMLPP